jgi:hypothetical protein
VDGDFWCQHNQLLQSLYGLPTEIGGRLHMSYSKTLPLLRALVAKGGVSFESDQHKADADKVAEIINLYKGQGKRAMFNCQKDLEDAGFEGNAKW